MRPNGWAFNPAAQGRGFAGEAVRAILAWGDARFRPTRTVCMIEPDNLASIRLAERCGYTPFEQAIYHDDAVILFERLGGFA